MEVLKKPDPTLLSAAICKRLFSEWQLSGVHFRVAYSGGMDSHVLLHLLANARKQHAFSLSAVHIDHGLQRQSAEWVQHCRDTCAALSVPFETRKISVTNISRDGLEAAAREARYASLKEMLFPGEVLLTAQHLDDQSETVMLQMLRGAGIAGLAAMPERAAFGAGELIRPLMSHARSSLRAYAEQHDLQWLSDPSNTDQRIRRNYLRSEIFPRLEGLWPDARNVLSRVAAHSAEAHELLAEIATADLAACRFQGQAQYPNMLSVEAVNNLQTARQRNLIRYWLKFQGYMMPSMRRLEELIRQVSSSARNRQACVRWRGVAVWFYRDQMLSVPDLPLPDIRLNMEWDPLRSIYLSGVGGLAARHAIGRGISMQRLRSPFLHVRIRAGGERLRLPGRNHHHAVKKLLQAESIPPWERQRLPLFYANEELVAVADRWVSADYAARIGEPALNIVWTPYAGLETR